MRRVRVVLAATAMLAAVPIILQGCGERGGREEAPAGAPLLNRGLATEPESLDPHKSRSVQAADVLRDIGEGLVSYDAAGELVPGTAESWEFPLCWFLRTRPASTAWPTLPCPSICGGNNENRHRRRPGGGDGLWSLLAGH